MNQLATPLEFDRVCASWRKAYIPVSNRELAAWERQWNAGLATMPYVRLIRLTHGPIDRMLDIRAVLNVTGILLKMVQDDMVRVWDREVAAGVNRIHTIREVENGLEMNFALLTEDDNFLTGTVGVQQREFRGIRRLA